MALDESFLPFRFLYYFLWSVLVKVNRCGSTYRRIIFGLPYIYFQLATEMSDTCYDKCLLGVIWSNQKLENVALKYLFF